MPHSAAQQQIVEYTALSIGMRIEGKLLTGQATDRTTRCPKCGRVGLLSNSERGKQPRQIVIHAGRVIDGLLEGIDSCSLTKGSTSSVLTKTHLRVSDKHRH